VKLPLLLFPLILGTIPSIDKKRIDALLLIFIGSVLFSTFYSFLIHKNVITVERDVNDVRTISRFISHIRLSMNICLVILLLFFYFKNHRNKIFLFFKLILTAWLMYFLYILESATGVMILFSCILVGSVFYAVTSGTILLRTISVSFLAIILISTGLFFYIIISNYYQPRDLDISNLDKRTKYGEVYQHDTSNLQLENGHYLWLYIAPVELEVSWNERSEFLFSQLDKKGQPIKWTLIRYLTSKGLRKDKEGIYSLSEKDITNIESGIASIDANSSTGLTRRIKMIMYEFDTYFRGVTPNGNSVTQRFEYWRVGWSLFKAHPLIGVGTGDVNDEYMKQYRKDKSELIYKFRDRAHNQYLTILISFGILGFLLFIGSLFTPLFYSGIRNEILYLFFFTLILVSFLGEDTLETQAGVTFFAFFNSLFIFQIFRSKDR
jgi:O-antigen ligase